MDISDLYTIGKVQNNVAITLKDNDSFSQTAYYFFHGGRKQIFLECVPVMYNGHVQLLYFTRNMTPLAEILNKVPRSKFGRLSYNLLEAVNEFSAYGFLEDACLLTNFFYIYVDIQSLEVFFIYIPLNLSGKNTGSMLSAGDRIRRTLAEYVRLAFPSPTSDNENYRIGEMLSDTDLLLDDIVMALRNTPSVRLTEEKKSPRNTAVSGITLRNHSTGQTINIDKNGLIIGRQAPRPEGLISGDREIGRKHCQILFEDDRFYIMDLHSKNGTRLNGKMLEPMRQVEIHSGDLIMIAGQTFACSFNRGTNE